MEEASRPHADQTTVISRALEQRALNLGLEPSTVHYVPNGCNVEVVQPVEQSIARHKLDLPLDRPLVGHCFNC